MICGAGAQGNPCIPPLPCPGSASNYFRVLCLSKKFSALPNPGSEIGKNALFQCFSIVSMKNRLVFCFVWECGLASAGEHLWRWAQWLQSARMFFFQSVCNYSPFSIAVLPFWQGHCPNAFLWCAQCVYNYLFCLCPWGKKITWVILPQACAAVCLVSAMFISTFLLMVTLIIFILACDSVSILAFQFL